MRKSLSNNSSDEKISFLDLNLKAELEYEQTNIDFMTLDIYTNEVSSSLDEKKSMDLKGKLVTYNNLTTKLWEIQLSLDIT